MEEDGGDDMHWCFSAADSFIISKAERTFAILGGLSFSSMPRTDLALFERPLIPSRRLSSQVFCVDCLYKIASKMTRSLNLIDHQTGFATKIRTKCKANSILNRGFYLVLVMCRRILEEF